MPYNEPLQKKKIFDFFTKPKDNKQTPIMEETRDYGRPDQVKQMEQVFWKEIEDAAINNDNILQQPTQKKKDKCILTTGDPSNFSGFLALILYYKVALDHGYDVVYVMNYPAFLVPDETQGVKESIQETINAKQKYSIAAFRQDNYSYEPENGRGHLQEGKLPISRMQTDEMNERLRIRAEKEKNDAIKKVNEMLKKEQIQQPKEAQDKRGYQYSYEQFKRIRKDVQYLQEMYEPEYKTSLENITMDIISCIWNICENKYSKKRENIPQLYCLKSQGIYNSINPLKPEHVIIEMNEYIDLIRPISNKMNENIFLETLTPAYFDEYNTILMDMNGSMSWFSIFQTDELQKSFCDKVKKCFVMGGFLENSIIQYKPFTNANVSEQASINQLYHPENVAKFFEIIGQDKLIFVTNNECHTNFSFDPKTYIILKDVMNLPKLASEERYAQDTGITKTFHIGLKNSNQFHIIPAFYLSNYIVNNKLFDKGTINTTKLYFNHKIGSVMLSSETKELPDFKIYGNVQIVSISKCTNGGTTDHINGREKYIEEIKELLLPNSQSGGNNLRTTIIYTPKQKKNEYTIIGHETIKGKKMEISRMHGSEKYYINIKKLDSKYIKHLLTFKKWRYLNSKSRKN
jgi:hypothetical protein